MIQGALFGQDDDDDYQEPNDSESTDDTSNVSFEATESVNEDAASATDNTNTAAEAVEQIEAVQSSEVLAVSAATEAVATVESETDDLLDTELMKTTSAPFVGAWQALVSQTNWEKGKIILDWREALVAAGAPVKEYSDEAWATLVQHSVTG